MKIFLSYASDYRAIADDLCCRLQAAGHEVFFDREDLPAGESYDERIRSAIDECALFIFLITPESVAEGHYTRTELKIASRKWPTPSWHVLPVQAADTPLDQVPAYLRALTILHAEGNLAADVLLERAVVHLGRRLGVVRRGRRPRIVASRRGARLRRSPAVASNPARQRGPDCESRADPSWASLVAQARATLSHHT